MVVVVVLDFFAYVVVVRLGLRNVKASTIAWTRGNTPHFMKPLQYNP